MARKTTKKRKTTTGTRKGRTPSRVRQRSAPRPAPGRTRRRETVAERAASAAEDLLRGPLQPEIPVDPDAPIAALDADAVEAIKDTQQVEDDRPHSGLVDEDLIDRKRGTVLTGGDVDAAWDEVDSGEETVGGSTPTPDQDRVDDLGRAAGVTYADTEPLRVEEKISERDDARWELDPASAEDYPERAARTRRRRRR